VRLFEPGYPDVGVDLCCRKAGVSQEVLYEAQIGAIVEKMGGVGMPDLMGSNIHGKIRQ
jgi:hypothetical protein